MTAVGFGAGYFGSLRQTPDCGYLLQTEGCSGAYFVAVLVGLGFAGSAFLGTIVWLLVITYKRKDPARKRVVGVIPARLASTRLPRKVLREVAGKTLLEWVVVAARACPLLDEVVVAADSEEVAAVCAAIGVRCVMTDPALASGTDRMHAVAQVVEADIYVNVQGDEPTLRPEHVAALLAPFARAGVEVTTLKVRCAAENLGNPNAVKVVTAADGRALYFSRATIPYDRDAALAGVSSGVQRWKHLGLYAYRRAALERFVSLPASVLEQTERLEQLRLLDHGMALYVAETAFDTVGVDTEEDLVRVEGLLRG